MNHQQRLMGLLGLVLVMGVSVSGVSLARSQGVLPVINMRVAQGSEPGAEAGPREGVLSQLNLSAEQKEKVKALMQTQRSQGHGGRQELHAKREQLMQMLRTGSGSKGQAIALMREISQAQTAMFERRIGFIYDLRGILTPEQFEKASQLMQQRRPGTMPTGGHVRGGPRPPHDGGQ